MITRRAAPPESFNDVLYHQIRRTPWWLLSLTLHAVIVFAMFSLPLTSGKADSLAMVKSAMDEYEELTPEEELPPPLDEERPVEQPEELLEPVPDDTKSEQPVEKPQENPIQDRYPSDDFLSSSPLQGPAGNSEIGVGGGAGGPGGRSGGRKRLRGIGNFKRGQEAVDEGLEWLKRHQNPEGYWDCDGFAAQCRLDRCEGAGNGFYDPGVSGLALLAFLGAGETHRHGSYKETVGRGLRYLRRVQDPEGCFGDRTDDHFVYNHAIATLAMTEAHAMTGSPLFKQSAQSGVDFIHRLQNPYLAWRYGMRPGQNDTSVTGWMVMALKSAKAAGLRVSDDALDGALTWIEKVTEPEYGRVGYTARGTGPARPEGQQDRFPADRSESLTAVGVLSRIFLGQNPKKHAAIRKGADLMLKALPVWDEESGAVDMYYWYYGTLAMFQVAGKPFERWNEAIETAVIGHQRKEGCARGSWDPVGPWGGEGGRVYSTALMVMCMEVYYRYDRVFGAGGTMGKRLRKAKDGD